MRNWVTKVVLTFVEKLKFRKHNFWTFKYASRKSLNHTFYVTYSHWVYHVLFCTGWGRSTLQWPTTFCFVKLCYLWHYCKCCAWEQVILPFSPPSLRGSALQPFLPSMLLALLLSFHIKLLIPSSLSTTSLNLQGSVRVMSCFLLTQWDRHSNKFCE